MNPKKKADPVYITDTDLTSPGPVSGNADPHQSNQHDQASKKEATRLGSLKTQHFIELLASIREKTSDLDYSVDDMPSNVRMYGMYVVMNRVYLTCLLVHHEEDQQADHDRDEIDVFGQKLKAINFLQDLNCANYAKFWPNKGYRFEVLYSEYLDIFKPGHLKALLTFVNFLAYYDYKTVVMS